MRSNFVVSFALSKSKNKSREQILHDFFEGLRGSFLRAFIPFALENRDNNPEAIISQLQKLHEKYLSVPRKNGVTERLFLKIDNNKIVGFYVWEPESKSLCNYFKMDKEIQLDESFIKYFNDLEENVQEKPKGNKIEDIQKKSTNNTNNQEFISTNNNDYKDKENNTNNQTESNKRFYVSLKLKKKYVDENYGKNFNISNCGDLLLRFSQGEVGAHKIWPSEIAGSREEGFKLLRAQERFQSMIPNTFTFYLEIDEGKITAYVSLELGSRVIVPIKQPIPLNDEFIKNLQGKETRYFHGQSKSKENLKTKDQRITKKTEIDTKDEDRYTPSTNSYAIYFSNISNDLMTVISENEKNEKNEELQITLGNFSKDEDTKVMLTINNNKIIKCYDVRSKSKPGDYHGTVFEVSIDLSKDYIEYLESSKRRRIVDTYGVEREIFTESYKDYFNNKKQIQEKSNKKIKKVRIKKEDTWIDGKKALYELPEKVGNAYFQREDDAYDRQGRQHFMENEQFTLFYKGELKLNKKFTEVDSFEEKKENRIFTSFRDNHL